MADSEDQCACKGALGLSLAAAVGAVHSFGQSGHWARNHGRRATDGAAQASQWRAARASQTDQWGAPPAVAHGGAVLHRRAHSSSVDRSTASTAPTGTWTLVRVPCAPVPATSAGSRRGAPSAIWDPGALSAGRGPRQVEQRAARRFAAPSRPRLSRSAEGHGAHARGLWLHRLACLALSAQPRPLSPCCALAPPSRWEAKKRSRRRLSLVAGVVGRCWDSARC